MMVGGRGSGYGRRAGAHGDVAAPGRGSNRADALDDAVADLLVDRDGRAGVVMSICP